MADSIDSLLEYLINFIYYLYLAKGIIFQFQERGKHVFNCQIVRIVRSLFYLLIINELALIWLTFSAYRLPNFCFSSLHFRCKSYSHSASLVSSPSVIDG